MTAARSGPSLWERLERFFRHGLWSRDPAGAGVDLARRTLQLVVIIGEGFVRDQLILRSHALTYFTMLSMIPLLAILVAVAGAVGLDGSMVVDLAKDRLAVGLPADVEETLVAQIESVNLGGLGGLGAGGLFAATILAIGTVEKAFNEIWGVKQQRPWVRRFPDYLAVLFVAPLMLGIAGPLAALLQSQWLVQRLLEVPAFHLFYDTGLRYTPLLVLLLGFAFLYWFFPNTSVRPLSALLGAAVAAVLFTLAQSLYLDLNVGVAKYDAFFGGFAFLPLLLVWIFISWAITLLGAEVSFAHQNLSLYRREVRDSPPNPAEREAIGLAIALEVARSFREVRDPWSDDALADALDVPVRTVRGVLSELEIEGIVARREGEEPGARYQLGRPAQGISVGEVLGALRGSRRTRLREGPISREVEAVMGEVDRAEGVAARNRSLADVLDATASHVDAPQPDH